MLVSYKHNFLFVHIAKTGGTSVRDALRQYRWGGVYAAPLALTSLFSQMTRPRHKLGIKIPRHAKAIAAKEMFPRDVYNGFFKFVVVRNPWDLQVSAYHHVRKNPIGMPDNVKTFAEFLDYKFDPSRPWNFMLDITNEPQRDYIVDMRGNVIVDFIGHYESLQDDFDEICRRVGVPTTALPHHRKAEGRKDYRSYYSGDLADRVAAHFHQDIEVLGYRFDPA
jgi:hypothetical protein